MIFNWNGTKCCCYTHEQHQKRIQRRGKKYVCKCVCAIHGRIARYMNMFTPIFFFFSYTYIRSLIFLLSCYVHAQQRERKKKKIINKIYFFSLNVSIKGFFIAFQLRICVPVYELLWRYEKFFVDRNIESQRIFLINQDVCCLREILENV